MSRSVQDKRVTGVPRPPESRARRRLGVQERQRELMRACLALIGTRPWEDVSMDEVARLAGASKPLLYYYFPTKSDLYLAAVRSAAEELRAVTTVVEDLPPAVALRRSLQAHVEWVDGNADAYRAVLQGGLSSDPAVQAIIETSRTDVVDRLARGFGIRKLTPAQRTVLRGWVGFLEAACLDWLANRDVPQRRLVQILATSVPAVIRATTQG
jgi:AcrR family transcriptional regulator